jgi:hypothetical protein
MCPTRPPAPTAPSLQCPRPGRARGTPNRARRRAIRAVRLLASWALACTACAGKPPVVEPDPGSGGGHEEAAPNLAAQPMIESEVGTLDKGAIKEAFAAAEPEVEKCVQQGRRERQALLGGAIDLFLRIGTDGEVRWAYLSSSTLGDHLSEKCIVDAMRARSWPKPYGGKEGQTTQQLELGEPDARPPVPWTEADLGAGYRRVASSLHECKRRAGTGSLQVTFYVEPSADGREGRAKNAGVAVSDEKGAAAIDCAVKTVLKARYPSPGSYTAKATVRVE